MEQELLNLPGHLSSTPGLVGVTRSLVLCCMFLDRALFFYIRLFLFCCLLFDLRLLFCIFKLFFEPAKVVCIPRTSHESGRSCVCLLEVSILPLSMILQLDYGTFPICCFYTFHFICTDINIQFSHIHSRSE